MLLLCLLCAGFAVALIIAILKIVTLRKSMQEIYTDFEHCL